MTDEQPPPSYDSVNATSTSRRPSAANDADTTPADAPPSYEEATHTQSTYASTPRDQAFNIGGSLPSGFTRATVTHTQDGVTTNYFSANNTGIQVEGGHISSNVFTTGPDGISVQSARISQTLSGNSDGTRRVRQTNVMTSVNNRGLIVNNISGGLTITTRPDGSRIVRHTPRNPSAGSGAQQQRTHVFTPDGPGLRVQNLDGMEGTTFVFQNGRSSNE